MVGQDLEDDLRRRRHLALVGEAGHRREGYAKLASAAGRCRRPSTTSPAIARWSRQERTICRTQALAGVLTFSAPMMSATISKAVRSPSAERRRELCRAARSTWRRASAIFASGSRKVRPWPGRTEFDLERLDLVEAGEELADRVGAVAVVEEEDRAAEQVVAGDQQLALGLVQDDVGGRVAGRLVDLPGAEVGLDLDPRHEIAVGHLDRVDAGLRAPACLAVALQPGERDAALAGHLDPLLQRRRRVVGEQPHVLPGGVHPELAAGGLEDRRGEPVVVGVGVGADQQADVLDPEASLGEGEVELAQPPLAAHPGVEEDDAAVGSDRPGVAVRDAGPGQRQPQPPDAGQHPLGPRRLRSCIACHPGILSGPAPFRPAARE